MLKNLLHAWLRAAAVSGTVTVLAASANAQIATGPHAGQPVPAFETLDQYGQRQTLETLSGPKGLLLLFHRSADW